MWTQPEHKCTYSSVCISDSTYTSLHHRRWLSVVSKEAAVTVHDVHLCLFMCAHACGHTVCVHLLRVHLDPSAVGLISETPSNTFTPRRSITLNGGTWRQKHWANISSQRKIWNLKSHITVLVKELYSTALSLEGHYIVRGRYNERRRRSIMGITGSLHTVWNNHETNMFYTVTIQ